MKKKTPLKMIVKIVRFPNDRSKLTDKIITTTEEPSSGSPLIPARERNMS